MVPVRNPVDDTGYGEQKVDLPLALLIRDCPWLLPGAVILANTMYIGRCRRPCLS